MRIADCGLRISECGLEEYTHTVFLIRSPQSEIRNWEDLLLRARPLLRKHRPQCLIDGFGDDLCARRVWMNSIGLVE